MRVSGMQVVRDIVHMYIVHPMPWGNEKKKKEEPENWEIYINEINK